MKNYKLLGLMILSNIVYAGNCKVLHKQCIDKSATRIINGVAFSLKDVCQQNGVNPNSEDCCWEQTNDYRCGEENDQCNTYRKSNNCKFVSNECVEWINPDNHNLGCKQYKSQFDCAASFVPNQSKICINAFCGATNSGDPNNAKKCYMPNGTQELNNKSSQNNLGALTKAITLLETGKQISDDMGNCSDPKDPKSCKVFTGKYYQCMIWEFQKQYNNGADCMLHTDYMDIMENKDDKTVYGDAISGGRSTHGNGYNIGDRYSYSLSNDDTTAINNSNRNKQNSGLNSYNNRYQDLPNGNLNASNQNMSLVGGNTANVKLSENAQTKIGMTGAYLTPDSAKLALNRMKSQVDPRNPETKTLASLGISRQLPKDIDKWGDDKPVKVQGLCLYLSNYCDGGDDKGTNSAYLRGISLGNANACGVCTNSDPIFGSCLTADPKPVREEWCCFNSKLAMDINLAAYDQNYINFYNDEKHIGKYQSGGNVTHDNGNCGGLTVGEISNIDFSKGDYFKDFSDNLMKKYQNDPSSIMNNDILQNSNVQINQQDATKNNAIDKINTR